MDKLDLNNSDRNFSPELLALMGEWLAFDIFERERDYLKYQEPPLTLTMREFFEKGYIFPHGAYTDDLIDYCSPTGNKSIYIEYFFNSYGVTKEIQNEPPKYTRIEPIIGYDDVQKTFRENLYIERHPIFPCFAYQSRGRLPSANDVLFSSDEGCYPLLETFCAEGYMAQKGDAFYWTSKVRPIMESIGCWKSVQELDCEARKTEKGRKEQTEKGEAYQKIYDESLSTKSIMPLIGHLKEQNIAGHATLVTKDAITILQNLAFDDAIKMFSSPEVAFRSQNYYASDEHKLIWHGDSV